MAYEIKLPVHASTYDKQYGRIDIAPRIAGQWEYAGEYGYLLAVHPNDTTYLVAWDDRPGEFQTVALTDFMIISNVTITK